MTDAALRDLAARAATGDGAAREQLTGAARAQARDILAEDRFHAGKSHEGPLHGLFSWLGDRLDDLVGGAPGDSTFGWLILAAIALAAAAAVATWLGGRRRRRAAAAAGGRTPLGLDAATATASPTELERRALAAERDGDLDAAIRLRFTAGLLRLDAIHAIDLRPSLTSGDVGRAIESSHYDDLAATHDAVAYGGHHATDTDTSTARETWPEVVREARR
ncbi:DUF4129 domain-containing protein [Baekduia sp. Peel2402]|uniref:DUF4129 domain-containing protein n=1 Tax=Baekduia sp. Peel2402 TaxID=3458296 RepID=UPI00403E98D7